MMPGERKSVEPMAAVTAPARTAAQHQSLLHFVGQSAWSDTEVLAKVGEMVLPKIEHHGAIEAWIIDDTGFPKKGEHSVGVARQYCGQLGKTDNCQVAVSLSLANHHASLPVAYQLYLPEEWSNDRKRLRKAGVPEDVGFKTKPEIALEQIAAACAAGLPRGVVLMDAAYGNNSDLRSDITALELTYAAAILSNTTVWAPGTAPLPAKAWSGRGRPPKRLRRDAEHLPISVKELAFGLPNRSWRTIVWRQGSAEPLSSRFARVRVIAARRDFTRSESWPEDRVAQRRTGADQILALDPSRRYRLSTPGRTRQTTLADRARLSGAQARGWARAFRRPRMARLSSSRHAVHRRLRIPDLREGDDSPLRLSSRQAVQDTCRSQRLPTQRLRRCEPNDTFRTRLRQSDCA
jgi:SRSO17 transposase